MGFAPLDLLVEGVEAVSLLRQKRGILLKEGFEVAFEGQHDLLPLRVRVELGIGGHVLEEDQGLFAELPEDALAGHLAFDEAAVSPHHSRGEELLGIGGDGFQEFFLDRRVQLDQFLGCLLEGGQEVPLGVLKGLKHFGLRQLGFGCAFAHAGQHLADVGVVLDELGNDYPHVIERQLADQGGQNEHQLAVGLLPMLEGPLHQRAQGLVLLFQRGALGLELLDA